MDVVAKVYDYEIKQSEFVRELNQLSKIVDNFMICTLQKRALEVIIDRYLLLHEAKETQVNIDTDEFDEELFDLINEYDTPDEYSSMLKKNDLSEEEFQDIVKNKILIQKHIEKFNQLPVEIPESKLRQFYNENQELFMTQEEVSCLHILIRDVTEISKEKIESIGKQIHSKEDFVRIATEYSECPSSEKCGDLGFFHRGKLIKEIDEVAFQLKMNEISKPFASKSGYHILMLVGKVESTVLPFEEIRDLLHTRLEHINSELALVKHLQELRQTGQNHIEIFEDNLLAPFNCLIT